MKNRKLLYLLVPISAAIVVTVIFQLFKNPDTAIDSAVQDSNVEEGQETIEKPIIFTENLFDLDRVEYITPLGDLHGGYNEIMAVGGVMIDLKEPNDGTSPEPMNIYAPTKMTLIRYSYYQFPGETEEWSLEFELNNDVTMTLWHIDNPVQKIKDVAIDSPRESSATLAPKETITFKVGEKMAETAGTDLAHNWNILIYDKQQTNQFINQERYESIYLGENLISAKCPFDYYPDNIKDWYIERIGYMDQNTTITGIQDHCGNVSKDVKGTLSGIWHLSPTGIDIKRVGDFVTPLAVHKVISGEIMIDMVGKRFSRVYENNRTYKDPKDVKTEHCYELDNGYAYFKIVSDTEMDVAYSSSGYCPNTMPTYNVKRYYR